MPDRGSTRRPGRVLEQRLLALAGIRAVVVLAVAAFLLTAGHDLVVTQHGALAVTTGLVLLAFSATVPLWPPPAHRAVLDVSVVVDAGGLAILLLVTGGPTSPFTPLGVLVVALHLLAFGTRTGLRIGVASTVALGWVWATGPVAVPSSEGQGAMLHPDVRILVTLLAIWAAVASVAVLTRVVERDLRLAAASTGTIHEIGRSMEPEQGPTGVARQVVAALTGRLGVAGASVWLPSPQDPGELALVAWHRDGEQAEPLPDTTIRVDGIVDRALTSGEVVVGRGRGPLQRVHDGEAALVRLAGDSGRLQGLLVVSPPGRRWRSGPGALLTRAIEEVGRDAGRALDEAHELVRLQQQARTDPVTGMPNHRALQERLRSELARAERRWAEGAEAALSLVLFDLDHFKRVNDRHGHPTGDAVLAAIARAVDRATRGADLLCRYGGEEFAVVLADTGPGEAEQASERFRAVLSNVRVTAPDGSPVRVTASFGVASVTQPGVDRSRFVDLADEALYRAKRHGRDRVVGIRAAASAPASG